VVLGHVTALVRCAYCYRWNSVVCQSVCWSRPWALQNSWTDRDVFGIWTPEGLKHYVLDVQIPTCEGGILRARDSAWGSTSTVLMPVGCTRWGHISATRQIWLNRPCVAAMRPYLKLFWPFVEICKKHTDIQLFAICWTPPGVKVITLQRGESNNFRLLFNNNNSSSNNSENITTTIAIILSSDNWANNLDAL